MIGAWRRPPRTGQPHGGVATQATTLLFTRNIAPHGSVLDGILFPQRALNIGPEYLRYSWINLLANPRATIPCRSSLPSSSPSDRLVKPLSISLGSQDGSLGSFEYEIILL